MKYAFIFAFFLVVIILLIYIAYIKQSDKKSLIPFDRLKKSEKQLQEFKSLPINERFENYEILKKAIHRLHSIVSNLDDINYEKQEVLNWDYLHSDVYILPYFNSDGQLSYISYNEAMKHQLPTGEYKEVDSAIGKYIQNGVENISIRLAIDNYLVIMCNRWLEEISEIENAISENKEAKST